MRRKSGKLAKDDQTRGGSWGACERRSPRQGVWWLGELAARGAAPEKQA